MQFLKRISSSVHVLAPLVRPAPPTLPSLLSQTNYVSFNPISFNPLRHFSVTPISNFITSSSLEQKKERKLFAHMYGGGDNGGVDYGHEVSSRPEDSLTSTHYKDQMSDIKNINWRLSYLSIGTVWLFRLLN